MRVKLVYILLFFLSILPIQLLYIKSIFLRLLNRYILKYRLNIIKNNLKLSFPKLSAQQRKDLTTQFYYHFFNVSYANAY